MSEDRESRINAAVSGLIREIIPVFEGEDDAVVAERQANARELARSILER